MPQVVGVKVNDFRSRSYEGPAVEVYATYGDAPACLLVIGRTKWVCSSIPHAAGLYNGALGGTGDYPLRVFKYALFTTLACAPSLVEIHQNRLLSLARHHPMT